MLDKCGEGTRYIYTGNSLESALLPNAVSVGARCDERESRLAGETMVKKPFTNHGHHSENTNMFFTKKCLVRSFKIYSQR